MSFESATYGEILKPLPQPRPGARRSPRVNYVLACFTSAHMEQLIPCLPS